ncbi:peptidase C12, ubiquitin carboxyl-terminal hydrolase [Amylocarpus encephaloides]|uniref:Ubiquitin carboxyl-terminal hydrolase n=1 Tax=Amylocarpus encephaloides TaxID=45428 RepID=A0A9P7YIK9_9HELO|nr:peptidase C12, ubiquitin carboxyl-terminal hydrolase [Amylocarpus encephaloides]
MEYAKRFDPIESDPQIFTELMHRLGVQENFRFDDVLDYKVESSQPALALIIIFPESQEDEQLKAKVEAKREIVITDKITFLKQTIDNSCGLVAIIHCVLNTVAANSISKPQDPWYL